MCKIIFQGKSYCKICVYRSFIDHSYILMLLSLFPSYFYTAKREAIIFNAMSELKLYCNMKPFLMSKASLEQNIWSMGIAFQYIIENPEIIISQ